MVRIRQIVFSVLLSVTVGLLAIAPALAQANQVNQSNQAVNQSASLVAPDPDMEISIYPKPDTHTARAGFGLSGDSVTVLEQVGSNSGTIWNRIQFEGATEAAGWVQRDYLSLQSDQQQTRNSQAKRGGYLGDRSSQGQRSPVQGYRQQERQHYQQDQQRNY